VIGGPQCLVPICERLAVIFGKCSAHHQRWIDDGRPGDVEAWAQAAPANRRWLQQPPKCAITTCRRSRREHGLCHSHASRWQQQGRVDLAQWAVAVARRCRPEPTADSPVAGLRPRATRDCVSTTESGGSAPNDRRSSRGCSVARRSGGTGSTCAGYRCRCGWRSPTRSNAASTSAARSPGRTRSDGCCEPFPAAASPRCWTAARNPGWPISGSPASAAISSAGSCWTRSVACVILSRVSAGTPSSPRDVWLLRRLGLAGRDNPVPVHRDRAALVATVDQTVGPLAVVDRDRGRDRSERISARSPCSRSRFPLCSAGPRR
jgi:hypothetical protein